MGSNWRPTGYLANRRKVQPGQLLAYSCWLYPAAVCLLTNNWSEFRILGFLFGSVGSRAKDVTVCPAVTQKVVACRQACSGAVDRLCSS